MKTVILVHGWGGSSKDSWLPWLKKELEKKDFQVITPDMPGNPDDPKIRKWVNHLQKIIKNPNKETYFIGHSMGCQAIMRYFEKVPKKTKVGGVLFVAGWFHLANLKSEEEKTAKHWTGTPIDLKDIKNKIKKAVFLVSKDEPFGFVEENSKTFKEKLNAKVITKENYGHFEDIKVPVILKTFLEMIK
ncbi:alpha/beta fold hydrolase [Candidatus Pacearchaeota archaeon]|nr:alpha/beta fold hydrolase [Candidatus Pacearchaeota archaeon]